MIPIYLLVLPGISAILNRYWRGEGKVARVAWYALMASFGFLATGDLHFTAIWLSFLLGYALLPWHAMFSAAHGLPPARRDHWISDWMQSLTYYIMDWAHVHTANVDGVSPDEWRKFGRVYGAVRSLPMMIPVIMFALHLHSFVPLVGVLFLGMGWVYSASSRMAKHLGTPALSIPFAEVSMGWLVTTYMLACAGS